MTGNPVRDEVLALAAQPYEASRGDQPFHLLIFGGSQGTASFSDVIPQALLTLAPEQRRRLRVVQQCRTEDLDQVRRCYEGADIAAETATFFTDLPARMAAAHLVIARSGAGTVSELAAIGRPGVLVPYPYATDDHQTRNAEVLDAVGGAWLLPEDELKVEYLTGLLAKLMVEPDLLIDAARAALGRAQTNAAQLLADAVLDLAANEPGGRAAA